MKRYFTFWRFLEITAIVILLSGCNGTREIIREVPVYLKDTTHETHTEYIFKTDTVINNTETIIREANAGDSELLAQLGLQLKDNERTILVLKSELMEKIHLLEQAQKDSSYTHNETPVPIKETEYIEVEKKLNWFQKTFIWIGVIGIIVAILLVLWKYRDWIKAAIHKILSALIKK